MDSPLAARYSRALPETTSRPRACESPPLPIWGPRAGMQRRVLQAQELLLCQDHPALVEVDAPRFPPGRVLEVLDLDPVRFVARPIHVRAPAVVLALNRVLLAGAARDRGLRPRRGGAGFPMAEADGKPAANSLTGRGCL